MTKKEALKLFEDRKVRTVWDDKEETWYFSVVDVVGVLTDQPDTNYARNYWKVLKHRLKAEGSETVTVCNQLKLRAEDGKMRLTDVADAESLSASFNPYRLLKQSLSNNGWHVLQKNNWNRRQGGK